MSSNSWSRTQHGSRNRYESSDDGGDDYGSHSSHGYDSGMSRSKSFSIERRGRFDRGSNDYGRGYGSSSGQRGRARSPPLPMRTAAPVTVKLDIDIEPSLKKEQQVEFLKQNSIKLLGEKIPPPAVTFEEMKLPDIVMKTISANSWKEPTPIQAVSIPVAMKGRDLIGIAKTGSGKTASFLIPAMVHILRQETIHQGDGPIVVALSPTRELAQQIDEVAKLFSENAKIRHACVFGGAGRGPQMNDLRKGPSIVVATPGRLIDFINSGVVSMSRVNFLILDEADRMLDMGFEPQIRQIIDKISKERQTMMFSATWPKEIRKLASDFLVDPVHMVIGSNELTTNSQIKQIIEKCEEYEKLSKCLAALQDAGEKKVIIFVKTKRTADDLSENLHLKGLRALSIHGDKAQTQRDFVLNKYRGAKTGILVATDVAARGLDVNDIDLVINYDFPGDIESYIHRIGRTARGNKEGVAITFFTDENKNMSRKLFKVMTQATQEVPEWLNKLASVTPKGAWREGYGRGGGGRSYGGGSSYGGGRGGSRGFGYGGSFENNRDSRDRRGDYYGSRSYR